MQFITLDQKFYIPSEKFKDILSSAKTIADSMYSLNYYVRKRLMSDDLSIEDFFKVFNWSSQQDLETLKIVKLTSLNPASVQLTDLMFTILAPFVEEGSFIHVEDDNKFQFAWFFSDYSWVRRFPFRAWR